MIKGKSRDHKKLSRLLAVATAATTMVCMTLAPASVFAAPTLEKEETVYVITDSNGTQNEVIVSAHLKNGMQLDSIDDKSNLTDIENVKGDESFEKGTGSALTWQAKGKDIYYQGKTNREVPVTMDVTYTLDGKEVSGKDLDGASGDLEISIKYENKTAFGSVKVPFIVMSGFIAQDNCFTHITVDHGKVIDDGEKQVVVGMAAPGLADNLGLSADDIGMGDSVLIKGKAKDFSVDDIMTIATSSVFSDLDSDKFGDMDFDDEINALDKGTRQLVKGSKLLYEGINTMSGEMPALTGGIDDLKDGADKVNVGTKSAQKGATALYGGLLDVSKKLPGVISELDAGTASMKTGADTLLGGLKQIKTGLDGDGTAENPGAIKILESVSNDMMGEDGNGGSFNEAKELYAYLSKVKGLIAANKDKIEEKGGDYKELADEIDDMIGNAKSLMSTSKKDGMTVSAVAEKLDDVSGSLGAYNPEQGAKQTTLIGGATVLDNGLQQMNNMIKESEATLNQGLTDLTQGASDLKDGEDALADGAQALADGMEQLQSSSGELVDGVDQLDQGSLKLSKGVSKLYKDGIKKIVDLYNNDLKGLTSGLNSSMDASSDYKSFTLLPDGMDGNTKFIYKTPITE